MPHLTEVLLEKHESQLAITAVVGSMGLQSNTVRFNGVQVPRSSRPLAHTGFTPKGTRHAKGP